MHAGIAFRPQLSPWLATLPPDVACLELTVEQVLAGPRTRYPEVGCAWPVVLNATRLSLGASDPLDPRDLDRTVRAACAANALWISAYLGRRRRREADLAYPEPVCPSRSALGRVIADCRRLMEACKRPLLIENVAAFRRAEDSMSEADFINQICDETGCGLLLDVTALALDERFGFNPTAWLREVNPRHVSALHLGGWSRRPEGRWAWRHEGRVPEEAWVLARELASRTGARTAILQRDAWFAGITELRRDLRRIAALDPVPSFTTGHRRHALAAS